MDRFTRTRIPARYSRYRHNTLDLHVLEAERASIVDKVEAAAVRLYFLLEHNYSLVTMSYNLDMT